MRRLAILLLLFIWPLAANAADKSGTPLQIGLFPNLTPLTLITSYQPLRLYLEKTLHRPVSMVTAPDFRSFVERTQHGDYDIVLTAPHLARLAEQDAGYVAVATYGAKLRALILVPKTSPVKRLADLRGARVAVPDPLAVVNMLGREELQKAGLAETEYTLVDAQSHNGAALAVLREEDQAAIIGNAPYAQLPESTRKELRVLATSQAIPNHYWLVNKKMDVRQRRLFQDAMVHFGSVPEGRKFIATRDCGEIRATVPDELKPLAPYAQEVRKLMGSGG
jgi:phosphonate transport system substrate-binding protein